MNFSQVLHDQKEEVANLKPGALIPREAERYWNDRTKLIRIITGVRRSGKSTFALQHLPGTDYAYVNFDDERLTGLKAGELNDLLSAIYEVYGEVRSFFFDEIQNTESWSLFVTRLHRSGNSVTITGSNSKLLSSELATHLTGRFMKIELFPFSFREFLLSKKCSDDPMSTRGKAIRQKYFNEYCLIGGFPEILMGEDQVSYARDLFYSIISRDIMFRHRITHQRAFKDLAIYLVLNTGKEISYNRLKNIFSLGSAHTARNYVDHLEEAYLITTLEKFSFKKQESLRYRKTYVIDPAFLRALSPAGPTDLGFIYETLVFLELNRRKSSEGTELFYYKDKREVDFVVKKNREIVELIQVCYDLGDGRTLQREVNALLEASAALKCENLTVINSGLSEERMTDGKKIRFIPILDWL
jgi:predicted AAA+ superfamily ATPase